MTRLCILITFLSVLHFVAGCKTVSYYENHIVKYEMNERLPHLFSSKYTEESLSGEYYFTYIPALFSEPDNVRKNRHQYLRSHFAVMFPKHGLIPSEYGKARYEVTYDYSTFPSHDGTFEHTFNLDINKREKDQFTTKRVWHGSVSISKATSSDISLYFNHFLFKILEGFPEPQNTLKDFIESMKE